MSAPGVADADGQQVDPEILYGLRVFRQPKWRAAVQAGLFLTLASLGLLMAIGQPPKPGVGWPIAVIGLALALAVPVLTTFGGRRRVELFEEGFVVHSLIGTRRHRWSEVSDFTLATMLPGRGMRQTYVVYDAEGDSGALVRFNRFLAGRGRSLPIGVEPEQIPGNAVTLALTMNAWRQRALDREFLKRS